MQKAVRLTYAIDFNMKCNEHMEGYALLNRHEHFIKGITEFKF